MSLLYLSLLILAFGAIECMVGGTRLLFSLPSYGVLALASLLTVFSIRRIKIPPSFSCLVAAMAMCGYVLGRSAVSPNRYLAWPDYYMVLGCLMVYLLTGFYLTKSRLRIAYVFFLLAVAVVHIWVGAIQFAKGNGFMLFGYIRPLGYEYRASGLYICPNHLAGYLEAVAVMGLSLVWWSRMKIWLKMLVGYLSAGCYLGVAISGSRGGYYSSVFSLLVFGILSLSVVKNIDRRKFVMLAVIFSLVTTLAVGGAAFLMARSSFLHGRMTNMASKDVRIYNWQATLDQFRLAPLLGTGSGTHLYYGRLFRRAALQSDPVHAHSDYLELLAEYGLAGMALLVVFLWSHLGNGLRTSSWLIKNRLPHSFESRSDSLALNIGALSAVAGLAAHSVIDFNMHIPGNALLFSFIFGLLANPGIENPGVATLRIKAASLFRFALPVVGLWCAISGIPKLPGEYFAEQSRIALREREYSKSIQLARKALGNVEPKAGWPDASIDIFGGAKDNPDIYFYLGESNRLIGLSFSNSILRRNYLNNAVGAYQEGLKIFPQDEHALVRMGQSFDALKRYDEAEAAFATALRWDPNLGVIYGYYGAHLKAMGREEESEAAYEKGQKLSTQSIKDVGQVELGL